MRLGNEEREGRKRRERKKKKRKKKRRESIKVRKWRNKGERRRREYKME